MSKFIDGNYYALGSTKNNFKKFKKKKIKKINKITFICSGKYIETIDDEKKVFKNLLRFGKENNIKINFLGRNNYDEESFYRMEAFSDNLKIDFQKDIILENVTYSYPKSSKKSLVDFNIMIPLGTSLGIVGSTGSGKTTLVDIILGLLNPSSGSIKVDDLTVDKSNLRSWQNLFGYVPQEIFLTDSTILENLAFGIPKDSIDQKQVENCAQMAQIHDFINELPEGYETVVGERGVRLSGGQRQRIGIARALYRKPKVLVFDEATSALDSITEKEVVRAINNLTNELTTIIVAHRLSTVQNCDQIILLDCGKVKEIGSYERLLEESELFRNMALV